MTPSSDNRSPEYFEYTADKLSSPGTTGLHIQAAEKALRAAADLARENVRFTHRITELVEKLVSAESRETELREKVRVLEHEIEVLRQYGNKDCTAMADEALAVTADEPKVKE